jgi:hypothetical protein
MSILHVTKDVEGGGEVLQTKGGCEPERDPGVSPNVLILGKKKACGRIETLN